MASVACLPEKGMMSVNCDGITEKSYIFLDGMRGTDAQCSLPLHVDLLDGPDANLHMKVFPGYARA